MAFQLVNFLDFTLATDLGQTSSSLVVLDSDLINAQIYDPTLQLALTIVGETATDHEIVYVTGRVGTTFTVLRGQENTAQRAWEQGTRIVAAPTVGVLSGLTQEGTAAETSYIASGLIRGNNLQNALDNAGLLIQNAGLDLPQGANPTSFTSGDKISSTANTTAPFDSNPVGRLTTAGLGSPVAGLKPSIPVTNEALSAVIVARVTNVADLDYLELRIGNSDTSYRWARFSAVDFVEGSWMVLPVPNSGLTQVGSSSDSLNYVNAIVKDDGTGIVSADISSISTFTQATGALTLLRQVSTIAELRDLLVLRQLQADVLAIVPVESIGAQLTDSAFRTMKLLNVGVVLTFTGSFQPYTQAQAIQRVFDAIQTLAQFGVSPVGVLYPDGYYGNLAGTSVKVLDLLSRYFERGFVRRRTLGFSGQEFPQVEPVFSLGGGEAITVAIKAPFESLLLDLSSWSSAQIATLLGVAGDSIRQNYTPPVPVALARNLNSRVRKAGDRMTGALSSAVRAHGTLGTGTEVFNYLEGNTHDCTINGNVTINPTNLQQGDVLQINFVYTSGSIAVSGTTQWELGGREKSNNFGDMQLVLQTGRAYRMILEVAAGIRTGVLQ